MTRLGYRITFTLLLLATPAFAQTTVAPEDFVLFGRDGLKARGLIVDSGDVGTNATLKGTKKIVAPESRLIAGTVNLHPGTTCGALLANAGQATGGCGPRTPVSTPIIADVAAACGAPNPFPTCNPSASVFVPHDGFMELGPGTYGDVVVSGGGAGPGRLVLTGGAYTFCNVRVNRNGQLLARSGVTVNITGDTKFDNGSNVGPESGLMSPCDVKFFSNGAKFRVSRKGHLQGVVCAPNAKLDFTQGATLRGAFFGREVKSDRVTLTQEDCFTSTTTTSTTTTSTQPSNLCGNGLLDAGEECDTSSPSGAFCPEGQTCVACDCQAPSTTTTEPAPTTTTSTSTTTTTITLPDSCGNGTLDTGEECDLSSPSGAFCPEGEECIACDCQAPSTTTTTEAPTTTVTTTTVTTTTLPDTCGNGTLDTGEECDTSSPSGAFCPEGEECIGCDCQAPSTTTTEPAPTTTTSTTTTTLPLTCGNGTLDTGEECDTSSPSGAFCPEGEECIGCDCQAPSTTTTSTEPAPSTTSSTEPIPTTTSSTEPVPTTSAPTTTTTSTTPTTTPPPTATAFDFLSTAGGGSCGQTFRDVAGTIPLKSLLCGNLSLGGGISQVPNNTTPPGSTNRFSVSGCAGGVCNVGPVDTATADFDCTTTGCFFGTPLPIANAGLSVCVTNTFSQPVAGTLNTNTGEVTMTTFTLNSATVLTGNNGQPCPRCVVAAGGAACNGSPAAPCTGVCDGSPNQGSACTTKNPNGLTSQCPSPAATLGTQRCYRGSANNNVCSSGVDCPGGLCAQFVGDIPITLSPLTTGTASKSAADGLFCTSFPTPPQQGVSQKGAFRTAVCQGGDNSGKPCEVNGDCPASTCRSGTLDNICAAGTNFGMGCSIDANCGASGPACTGAGQGTCAAGNLCQTGQCVPQCVKAGTLAQLIRLSGTPAGALTTGVGKPIALASVFCVPNTVSDLVNANANLPGPGATALVGTITLVP